MVRSFVLTGGLAALMACSGNIGASADAGSEPVADASARPDASADADASATADARAGLDDASADAGPGDSSLHADAAPISGLDLRPPNGTCVAPDAPNEAPVQLRLQRVFAAVGGFTRPLFAAMAPGASTRWYVLEQPGRVWVFDNLPGVNARASFIDITDRVDDGPNEAGLLGMAFHPDYSTNGYVYLSYTADVAGQLVSRISRFTKLSSEEALDPASEQIILTQDQPFGNHNGGCIQFGPDRLLYIALGDGGSGGDPQGNGQNLDVLLGKILRIDVDRGQPYAIPSDNPFASGGGAAEIYAWGLRNPWRFSFDLETGELWAGDVGQGAQEEIDLIVRGGNYGWRTMEGDRCYDDPGCDRTGLVLPVATYGRNEGVSVTGGVVYRGQAISELVGQYLYADFSSGRMWGLSEDPMTGARTPSVLLETGRNIASFAQSHDGEVFLLDLGGGMYSLERVNNPQPSTFPQRLSETGCFDPLDPKRPGAALIPYDLNAPLWSDTATKSRYFAIPDGTTIGVGADGDLDFPNGSVLAKHFSLGGRWVETRLFMRHLDGRWAGYTYHWNDAQTEATLLPAGRRVQVGTESWLIPSRGQCLQCHSQVAGGSLGLELGQLNRDLTYPQTGRTRNQLVTLDAIGVFTSTLGGDVTQLPRYPSYGGPEPIELRARAYLHANCAGCHRPQGLGRGQMDLRFATSLADSGLCGVPENGDLGIAGARIVAPGEPSRSVISHRMSALGSARMPPLGSEQVDPVGTALIDAWIRALATCP